MARIYTHILNELKTILKTAAEQLTSSSKPTTKGLSFTNKFRAQAQSYGLTEKDAEDVYYHGEVDKWNKQKMRKFYGSYTISIFFFYDKRSGQPVISSIRKT